MAPLPHAGRGFKSPLPNLAVPVSCRHRISFNQGMETMRTIRKLMLALMVTVAAAAAMPVLTTGALAECPPTCPQK